MKAIEDIQDTHVTVRNAYTGGVYFVPQGKVDEFKYFVDEFGTTPPWALYAGYCVR